MKLYMHPISTTSRPVRLFIAEHQLPVEEEEVDIMTGAHYQPPYSAINPYRCSKMATCASPKAQRF
jgi:glutathione S-transferase